jgi:hypothetical protein
MRSKTTMILFKTELSSLAIIISKSIIGFAFIPGIEVLPHVLFQLACFVSFLKGLL